ncbi:G-D-S-L family lipolytic protein [Pedobacter psychrophilus]|uniref:G-D-S-L family lipolytic protein n=1 Tax=Pedobacter psychrophilus TaxID=1826909 RepID=A0A179DIN8_9SPHI|nr:SGNH/GDSL hydrolase family protein [Pedobacter psychrophilus]OAQ40419.1 G-D-S-L family lipolytic protein [Pedobacter psychrophilus]
MRTKNIIKCFFALILALNIGCKSNTNSDVEIAPQAGSANFTRYISLGNSLTAGYADNGLYLAGQLNSFPSIIAQQMKLAGGGEFLQPLFSTAQKNGSGYLKYGGLSASGSPNLIPVTTDLGVRGTTTIPGFGSVTLYTKYTTDINNYGVPGIKLRDIKLAVYGNVNGFYERLLPGNAGTNSTTYLDFATAKDFTFFSNWLGNNDVLAYATTGGVGDFLTPKADFNNMYAELLDKLTAKGAKGIVATIPDVSSIPYFNTVTVAAVLAGVKAQAPTVTALYIATSTGARAATSEDLIILPFPTSLISPLTFYGLSPLNPIESKYVLDKDEVAIVRDFVGSYNTSIKTLANAKGLAIFDAFEYLNTLKGTGRIIDGVTLNSSFIQGKVFSLDGVHLTPMGYAVVANEMMTQINLKYGSTLPKVNLGNYTFLRFN